MAEAGEMPKHSVWLIGRKYKQARTTFSLAKLDINVGLINMSLFVCKQKYNRLCWGDMPIGRPVHYITTHLPVHVWWSCDSV